MFEVARIIDRVHAICEKERFTTRFAIRFLEHEAPYFRDENSITPASSTRKIFIMMAILAACRRGDFFIYDRVVIEATCFRGSASSGCLQYLDNGLSLRVYDLLVLMIIASDNVATAALVNLVGINYLNDYCAKHGYVNTRHVSSAPIEGAGRWHPVERVNYTTAKDVGNILERIFLGANNDAIAGELGCFSNECRLALKILSWQQDTTPLNFSLPANVEVANKHGIGYRNLSDAGLVSFRGRPLFIAAIYTEDVRESGVDESLFNCIAFNHLVKIIRELWLVSHNL